MKLEHWEAVSDIAALECLFCENVERGDVVHSARELMVMHLMANHAHDMAERFVNQVN